VTTLQAMLVPQLASHDAYRELTVLLSQMLIAVTLGKLAWESVFFRHLRGRIATPLKQTALLMSGELKEITTARFLLGLVGGVLLPGAFVVQQPAPGIAALAVTVLIFVLMTLGESLERHLFFIAAIPPRMPGGIAA
jgi:hypothetical protein